MRDLTPYLMGDPCTAYRRQPTQAEMDMHSVGKWTRTPMKQRKRAPMWQMQIGESFLVATRTAAISACRRLREGGIDCRMEKCAEGHLVRRVA